MLYLKRGMDCINMFRIYLWFNAWCSCYESLDRLQRRKICLYYCACKYIGHAEKSILGNYNISRWALRNEKIKCIVIFVRRSVLSNYFTRNRQVSRFHYLLTKDLPLLALVFFWNLYFFRIFLCVIPLFLIVHYLYTLFDPVGTWIQFMLRLCGGWQASCM